MYRPALYRRRTVGFSFQVN